MANYLITGAAGGMGAALCRHLAAQGHRVWGLDRETVETGETGEGRRSLQADITDGDSLRRAFARVRAEAGQLDGIIHAAGVYDLASLVEMPEEAFCGDFDVNVFGVFRVNRIFLPLLARRGRIVIITSELAPLHPLPFTGIYGVTKTALERYGESLRMELALLDRQVIIVRPGAVRTAMLPASTEKLARFCSQTELYRFSAARFREIVDRVEARSVPPERIAGVIGRALAAKRPRLVYNVNRNPLLRLLNALPQRLQLWIIRRILTGGIDTD